MKIRPGLEFAGLTDVGCVRENNEDSFGYWEPESDTDFERLGRLAIVADGMGGCEGGHVASALAVEAITQSYSRSFQLNPQHRLLEAFYESHRHIQEQARQDTDLIGMGTTCTAFVLVGRQLYFAHVGDSRLYLLRDGRFRQLTRDHTLVAHLIETGAIHPDQAENHPQKHVLTSAMGVSDDLEPDAPGDPRLLQPADVLLQCTDGLWGQITDPEMQRILAASTPADACHSLIQVAKDRGGPDNITLQVARIG
jgi:serine/threonine protein phosphatase PrpC